MKHILIFISGCLFSNILCAQTWSAVGNGVNGRVSSFAVYNGELYVAGQIMGPNGYCGLMKWNGTAFDTLPGYSAFGIYPRVEAMEVYNGELYLGGAFASSNNIAKWNGTSFSAVGGGCDNIVYSMRVYNGNLYVGGDMHTAGLVTVNSIAKWDGNQWFSVGGGITGSSARVFELEVYNNELYAAGSFYFAALNTWCIARWNDTIWNEVGTGGINGVVHSLGKYNNEIYAGGPYFSIGGGIPVNEIASWNGTTWTARGNGIAYVGSNHGDLFALQEYHNEIYAGGYFAVMDGDSIMSIARYNGSVWDSLGTGVDSTLDIVDTILGMPLYAPHEVYAFIEFNNDLYVGGSFNMIGGLPVNNIAKWSTPVGIDEPIASNSIAIFPNPTVEKIFIEGNLINSFYKLYDVSGGLIAHGIIKKNSFELQLQSLTKGIYFLSVINRQQTYYAKIIKH